MVSSSVTTLVQYHHSIDSSYGSAHAMLWCLQRALHANANQYTSCRHKSSSQTPTVLPCHIGLQCSGTLCYLLRKPFRIQQYLLIRKLQYDISKHNKSCCCALHVTAHCGVVEVQYKTLRCDKSCTCALHVMAHCRVLELLLSRGDVQYEMPTCDEPCSCTACPGTLQGARVAVVWRGCAERGAAHPLQRPGA